MCDISCITYRNNAKSLICISNDTSYEHVNASYIIIRYVHNTYSCTYFSVREDVLGPFSNSLGIRREKKNE